MPTTNQIDLNTLTIFDAVVEAGGFTAAAERLGVAKAKISVQIARLEKQLACTLFTRTTRRVSLTEAGRQLHEQTRTYLPGLRDALADLGSAQTELHGSLRISASVMHASQSIAPALAKFSLLHPNLQIDLRTGDKITDLIADGIDLSFRMGWLRDSSQRAIKLGEFEQVVIAAPAYLKKFGTPKRPEDLREHFWVALSLLPSPLTWKFTNKKGQVQSVHMKSKIQVDAPSSLLALVQNGAGISIMDAMSAQGALKQAKLVQLLPEWRLASGGIYAVLPPGRHVPAKVRAFIDFYRDTIEKNLAK